MNRLDLMLERLPPPWRIEAGSLIWQLLQIVANHLEAFDEDMDRVQRSHWIDTAFDRVDLDKLGALFEVPSLAWEPDELYRQRLKATIAARLDGAVTPAAILLLVQRLLDAADGALGTASIHARGAGPRPARGRLIEFPPVRVRPQVLRDRRGLVRPLDKFTLTHKGLAPSPLEGVITGVTGRRTSLPTLVNLSTGQLLCYRGRIPAGASLRLWVSGVGAARVARAELDGVDVSAALVSGAGFVAGGPLPLAAEEPAVPLMLERGDNRIWFVPLGLFDLPGFDGSVFSSPEPKLEQGHFSSADAVHRFDEALFIQAPGAALDLWWDELRPARFELEVRGVGQTRERGRRAQPETDRARLLALLDQTVTLVRAAAVDGRLTTERLCEQARTEDRLSVLRPDSGLESSPQAAELDALGALFDFTAKDGARFE